MVLLLEITKLFFTCIPTSTGSKVDHYRVRYTDDNKLTVDDETFFENLTKLVQVGDNVEKQHSLVTSGT